MWHIDNKQINIYYYILTKTTYCYRLNAEADMRIYLFSSHTLKNIYPDMKKICNNVKQY